MPRWMDGEKDGRKDCVNDGWINGGGGCSVGVIGREGK